MSYDKKCFELAESFLDDHPHLRDRDGRAPKLAQHIQDAIETWIAAWESDDADELQGAREAYADEKRERRIEEEMEARREAADLRRKELRESAR